MTELPRVSALVPCYNAEAFLQRTLDCLAAQTWPNLEIVIADDASSDATWAVVEAFAKGRPNVVAIRRDANLGWLANSNDLMARSSGDFLFFAFHDDVVTPDYVEKLARKLMATPDAILAYSWLEVTEPNGDTAIHRFRIMHWLGFSRLLRAWIMVIDKPRWYVPNRGLFRREAFTRIGGIPRHAGGEYAADWTWLFHMVTLGRFVMVPEVLCRKFYLKTSLSKLWARTPAQVDGLVRSGLDVVDRAPLTWVERALFRWWLNRRLAAVDRTGHPSGN